MSDPLEAKPWDEGGDEVTGEAERPSDAAEEEESPPSFVELDDAGIEVLAEEEHDGRRMVLVGLGLGVAIGVGLVIVLLLAFPAGG